MYSKKKIGTPQGGNLSLLRANIYLNELDKELEKRGLRFTRYADDCIICVKSEPAANRVMKSITKWLEEKRRVQVNATKSKVCKPNDMKYLGSGFYQKDGRKPKPHIKPVKKFKTRLKERTKRSWSIDMATRIREINSVIRGWINYFKIGNFKMVLRQIDGWLHMRLRICIWKQWKTPQKRRKSLIKLGFNARLAYIYSYTRKGYMRIANSPIMETTVTRKILKLKGLLIAEEYYQIIKTQSKQLSLN